MGSLRHVLAGAAAVGIMFGAAAQATPIDIENASFEAPQFAQPGDYRLGAPDGWASPFGEAGTWRPDSGSFDYVPDGQNIGYVFASSHTSQTLAVDLAANTRYTLSLDYGRRRGLGSVSQILNVALFAGDTLLTQQSVLADDLAEGTWDSFSLDFTSLATVAPGQKLRIDLWNGSHSAYFDNIRLDAAAFEGPTGVPEPATLGLLGLGIIGIAAGRRRRTAA